MLMTIITIYLLIGLVHGLGLLFLITTGRIGKFWIGPVVLSMFLYTVVAYPDFYRILIFGKKR